MGCYLFHEQIDAKNPKDPKDPPPKGWDTDVDTKDYRKALFGSPTRFFEECRQWEERELGRLGYRVELKDHRASELGMVATRVVVKNEPVT